MKHQSFNCYVDVRGLATNPDDEGLPGIYLVAVSTSQPIDLYDMTAAQKDVIANHVLDAFHCKIGIEEIDDFAISVYLDNGKEIYENDDHAEGEVLIEASAVFYGKINPSDLPPALVDLPNSKMMKIGYFIDAAEQHGKDEDPDHEVGDLQAFIYVLWDLLTPSQKKAFILNEKVQGTLEGALADNEYELKLVQEIES